MSFKAFLHSFVVSIFLTGYLWAQDTSQKGRKIIDQAIAALGGDHYLHMRNRVASGRIYAFFHDQLSGLEIAKVYVEYSDAPPPNGLAIRERELLGKKQDYSFLFLSDQALGCDLPWSKARSR